MNSTDLNPLSEMRQRVTRAYLFAYFFRFKSKFPLCNQQYVINIRTFKNDIHLHVYVWSLRRQRFNSYDFRHILT